MNDFSNPAPIATPEQYRAAILAVRQRMTPVQLAMLQAHCKSSGHTISTTRLAELLNLATPGSANIPYRNYARWIADELKYVLKNSKSKHAWWLALAYGVGDGEIDHDYEWIMRPELVAALQAMKWA